MIYMMCMMIVDDIVMTVTLQLVINEGNTTLTTLVCAWCTGGVFWIKFTLIKIYEESLKTNHNHHRYRYHHYHHLHHHIKKDYKYSLGTTLSYCSVINPTSILINTNFSYIKIYTP